MPTAEVRKNMVADRAYSPGLFAPTDRRASLFFFAAAVPTVGFVHGVAGLNRLKAAALEGYVEARFVNRAPRIDTAPGKSPTTSPQSSRLWPLALRWFA
jgi:hypothetical protein